MRKVLSIDLDNHCVTVQPGVINSWVTRAVAGEGFYYALILQSSGLQHRRQRGGKFRWCTT